MDDLIRRNDGDMINCTDCIKHGGDWECDRTHCRKGTKQQATKASDYISRQAVSSWLKQYGQDVLHGKYKFSLMYIWKNLMDLPSAELEIIRCKDCKHWEQQFGICGVCTSDDVWMSLYGDTTEVDHIGTNEDFYCGHAEK